MLKLIRKHKRDYWCYSISKKNVKKKKKKNPLMNGNITMLE
jgi:hypothetical protein